MMSPEKRRKRGRSFIISLLAANLGLFVYWISSEYYYAVSISPEGMSTASDYFKRFGDPTHVQIVNFEGKQFYDVTGNGPPLHVLALPSSRPSYIFDENGRLVDWCRDPGDFPAHHNRWERSSTGRLSVAEFRQKFGK